MKSIEKRLPAALAIVALAMTLLYSCGSKKKDAETVEWKIEIGAQRLSYIAEVGKTMTVEWQRNDVIDVKDLKHGTVIGHVNPTATSTMKTVLCGFVEPGLAVGDSIDLNLPAGDLDYTGQNGSILNIYSRYSYADGRFAVTEVDEAGHTIRTNDSIVALKQAVVAMRLLDAAGQPIPVDTLIISSANTNVLIKSGATPSSAKYGNLTVTNGNADKSSPIYVAIRNKRQDIPDTYTLLAKTRQGRYTASFEANLLYGRAYSKIITMQKK